MKMFAVGWREIANNDDVDREDNRVENSRTETRRMQKKLRKERDRID